MVGLAPAEPHLCGPSSQAEAIVDMAARKQCCGIPRDVAVGVGSMRKPQLLAPVRKLKGYHMIMM